MREFTEVKCIPGPYKEKGFIWNIFIKQSLNFTVQGKNSSKAYVPLQRTKFTHEQSRALRIICRGPGILNSTACVGGGIKPWLFVFFKLYRPAFTYTEWMNGVCDMFEGFRRNSKNLRSWCWVYFCGQVIPHNHYSLPEYKLVQIKLTLSAAFKFSWRVRFPLRRKMLNRLVLAFRRFN